MYRTFFYTPSKAGLSQFHRDGRSIDTVLPSVYQAGQWVYSPSGLPISILMGKLAADKVLKHKTG
jgi:hypothetical protein